MKNDGKVYLIGAGPGAPELITVAGMRLLESADVVVHDRLIDRKLIARSRPDAEIIDVGKTVGEQLNAQQDINKILIAKARSGMKVVRLKGGDPFIFGRGGEEAQILYEAEVPFEVVPGVSSVVAAPAYAGIPLTYRNISSSVTIVTGSKSSKSTSIDWDSLATLDTTLVILMGWDNFDEIVSCLLDAGKDKSTPIALIQWGSEPYQRTLVGTLGNIKKIVGVSGIGAPVVIVIGDVVKFRDKLRWFDKGSLFGKRVLVTRSESQAGSLAKLLYQEGAHVHEIPTIRVEPIEDKSSLDNCIKLLNSFDWIIFTSSNAVEIFFSRLNELGMDSRTLYTVKIAAIGSATASDILDKGIKPDFIPEGFVSESVILGLSEVGVKGANVLIPGALVRRDTIFKGLEKLGASVTEVPIYINSVPDDAAEKIHEVLKTGLDIITFTSGSTIKNLIEILDGDVSLFSGLTVATIGPVTSSTAIEYGIRVDIQATEHTVVGLVDSIKLYLEGQRVLT